MHYTKDAEMQSFTTSVFDHESRRSAVLAISNRKVIKFYNKLKRKSEFSINGIVSNRSSSAWKSLNGVK